ncbi:alpha/beta hydrolase [Rhizobium rhizophilum]|uniref:Alpha/beta hydrolase n=1 Tax=Rhizobium rhizophilum TaxID=1850373 RepID=A0ABY2QRX7_9HYPH|nr:alpha/beta hydrolase [Rhizobium rhizophilum]
MANCKTDFECNSVKIDHRRVPVPSSISAEARQRLHNAVRDDGIPINALYPMPPAEDHGAWRKLKAAVDANYAGAVLRQDFAEDVEITTKSIGSAIAYLAIPLQLERADCVYIDLHGGALVFGSGDACREGARIAALRHGIQCYGVDYRMPPDFPYPAALDDCMCVYKHAVDTFGADRVVIGGRSAGGNLALATVLHAQDEGLDLPGAVVLLSPEIDLTQSGDSFQTNRTLDVNLPSSLMQANLLYANGADLSHPYISPLFGQFNKDFPPTIIQSGTRDLLLSNAVRLHRALRQAGATAELHVFEAMPHGGFGAAPEDEEVAQEMMRFVRECLSSC